MFRIDSQGAVAAPDATEAVGSIVGFFTEGNPATATPATVVSADWANTVQEELIALLTAAGIAPSKTDRDQVLEAIKFLIENKVSVPDFVVANNQSVDADITGLVFDKTLFKSAIITMDVYRKDVGQENSSIVTLKAVYKPVANAWTLLGPQEDGDETGMTFTIVPATGQIQYQSTNYAGGVYVGVAKIKVERFKI